MSRWLLRYSLALGCTGLFAAVLVGTDARPSLITRPAASPTTTTTTTIPSVFGPVPTDPDGAVRVVRTPTGLVLPVIGGEPGAWLVRTPCANEATTPGEPITGAHVVLDPGHGGEETGAISPSRLSEAVLNLDVAQRTKRLLEAEGATVVLTRESEERITLQTRAEIAIGLHPLVFVSIHHNAGARRASTTPGSEVYHQLDDPASTRLAGLIFEEYQSLLGAYGSDWVVGDAAGARARQSVKTGDDFYGVLRRTDGTPSVLSEAAYLSNPAEDALLNTEQFRESEATAIATAIIRFVTTPDPGSGFVSTWVSDESSGGGGGQAGCEDPQIS